MRFDRSYSEIVITQNLTWSIPRLEHFILPLKSIEVFGRRIPEGVSPMFNLSFPDEQILHELILRLPSRFRAPEAATSTRITNRHFEGFGTNLLTLLMKMF
jgi:hypothetical protein